MNKFKEMSEEPSEGLNKEPTQKTKKPTKDPIRFQFTASIVNLVLAGIILLIIAEITTVVAEVTTGLVWHTATLIAHLGVAFIVAGLVAFALEIPHNKEYIKKMLSDIVIKRDFLKTLDDPQLTSLRRDCDLARLNFPDEETAGGAGGEGGEGGADDFTREIGQSFYKYVAEEAWTKLITSNYRTDYTKSTIFSDNNCPDGFWLKKDVTKYTLYKGIPIKNEKKKDLKICKRVIFDIDHKLLEAQPGYPGSSNCALTEQKCCFAKCKEECLFISTFQVTISDANGNAVSYTLDLKDKTLNPIDEGPEPIKVDITPRLSEGEVTMGFNHRVVGDGINVEIVQSGLVKKVNEITSVKMNIPTRDAVFIFNFPEGVVTKAIYFGFREANPFSNKGNNNVHARVPTWMFPGDGIAISWAFNRSDLKADTKSDPAREEVQKSAH